MLFQLSLCLRKQDTTLSPSRVEQRFRNLEPEVPFHHVPYRLVQSPDPRNHHCCGGLYPAVPRRQRQRERQSQLRLKREMEAVPEYFVSISAVYPLDGLSS